VFVQAEDFRDDGLDLGRVLGGTADVYAAFAIPRRGGSGEQSISIRDAASLQVSMDSPMTAAMSWPWNWMRSVAKSGSSWREGPVLLMPGMSEAVRTALTPGAVTAFEMSSRVIVAWAWVERTGQTAKAPRRMAVSST
jgi:hypothetical protein